MNPKIAKNLVFKIELLVQEQVFHRALLMKESRGVTASKMIVVLYCQSNL
jgi:hypothetical protein